VSTAYTTVTTTTAIAIASDFAWDATASSTGSSKAQCTGSELCSNALATPFYVEWGATAQWARRAW